MPLTNPGNKKAKSGKAIVSTPARRVVPPPPPKDTRKQQTIRLSPAQWRRVKNFALDEDATFQQLAVRGISRLMEARGLPPLED